MLDELKEQLELQFTELQIQKNTFPGWRNGDVEILSFTLPSINNGLNFDLHEETKSFAKKLQNLPNLEGFDVWVNCGFEIRIQKK